MSNITLSMEDDLVRAGRKYARDHHMSLNSLIRRLLNEAVVRTSNEDWIEECFRWMDKAKGSLNKSKFNREDLYRV